MIFRFAYELAVGVITIGAIILFGSKGQAAFALLALLPLILRILKVKPDERELALFYKSGNLTLALLVSSLFFFGLTGLEDFFIKNWMFITASALLIAHGLAGLIIFKLN
jgi:hypothetical protein